MPQNHTPITVLLSKKHPEVHSAAPDQTVSQAVSEMNRHRIGSLVVLENQKLVGIFTERDVLTRVVAENLDPTRTKVSEVMTREPQFLRSSDTIDDAMELMTRKRTRHLPVFDSSESLVGLISIGDITRWQIEENRNEAEHLKNYVFGEFSA